MTEQQVMDLELPKVSQNQLYKALYNHIREAYDGFISGLKPSTARTYGWIVLKFLASINSGNPLVLRQYNATQWNKYAEENFKGLKEATIALRVGAIKSFFTYLIEKGERKNNPLEGYVVPKQAKDKEKRIILTWNQIQQLKQLEDEKLRFLFEAAYYNKSPISELGMTGSSVSYFVKKMGETIGISGLKYSDITESRKKYYTICPVTGEELEMTEDNWMFKDGLLKKKGNIK